MKILLATDSSASSEAVTSEVARRPWPQGTEVCVLSVVGLGDFATWDVADAVAEAEGEDARALAQSAADRISSRHSQAHAMTHRSRPRAPRKTAVELRRRLSQGSPRRTESSPPVARNATPSDWWLQK